MTSNIFTLAMRTFRQHIEHGPYLRRSWSNLFVFIHSLLILGRGVTLEPAFCPLPKPLCHYEPFPLPLINKTARETTRESEDVSQTPSPENPCGQEVSMSPVAHTKISPKTLNLAKGYVNLPRNAILLLQLLTQVGSCLRKIGKTTLTPPGRVFAQPEGK